MGANYRNGVNSSSTFWRVKGNGMLYRTEKTKPENAEEEGWIAIEIDGKGTYWHLECLSISGTLSDIRFHEYEFDNRKVRNLNITLYDEEENHRYIIQLPMVTRNRMDDYVKGIACIIPNLNLGDKLVISPARKKDSNGFLEKRTLYVGRVIEGEEDNPLVELAHKFGGDVPAIKTTTSFDGKKTSDFSEQDRFLYNIIEANLERLKPATDNQAAKSEDNSETKAKAKPKTTAAKKKPAVVMAEDDDELPF